MNHVATPDPSHLRSPKERFLVAWWLLILLFGLLLYTALAGALQGPKSYEADIARLQHIVTARQVPISNQTEILDEDLKTLVGRMEGPALTSARAAHIYAAAKTEQRRMPDAGKLVKLKTSPTPSDRTLYTLYTSEKLLPEAARSIAGQFPGGDFLSRLTRVQALEKGGDQSVRDRDISPNEALVMARSILAGLVVLSVSLGLWVAYLVKRPKPLGHPAEPMSLLDADSYALRMLLPFGAYVLLPSLVTALLGRVIGSSLATIASFALMLAMLPAALRMGVLGRSTSVGQVLGDRSRWLGKFGWAAGGFVANLPILLAMGLLGSLLLPWLPARENPAVTRAFENPSTLTLVTFVLQAVIFAPILEEILFRGLLLPAISRVVRSPALGITINSLAFAMIHPQGAPLWFALAAVGGMCAVLTYQTRSLLPAIFLHMLHNGAVVAVALLSQ